MIRQTTQHCQRCGHFLWLSLEPLDDDGIAAAEIVELKCAICAHRKVGWIIQGGRVIRQIYPPPPIPEPTRTIKRHVNSEWPLYVHSVIT